MTSIIRYNLRPRALRVERVIRLTPRMTRVVLGGDDLEAGFPFPAMAAGDHVKLFFPEDNGDLVMPVIGEMRDRRPTFRDYTVRNFDPDARELSIDFVLHGHGPGGTWAAHATSGDRIGVLGPRGSQIYPDDAGRYLLAGDETALPAIGRWIEGLPPGVHAIAVVEVADTDEEQRFSSEATVDIQYLHRNGAEPGTTDLVEKVIREVAPTGEFFTWIAGEATSLKPVRRYLLRELEIPRELVHIDGYWKRGVSNLDHHATDDDE